MKCSEALINNVFSVVLSCSWPSLWAFKTKKYGSACAPSAFARVLHVNVWLGFFTAVIAVLCSVNINALPDLDVMKSHFHALTNISSCLRHLSAAAPLQPSLEVRDNT